MQVIIGIQWLVLKPPGAERIIIQDDTGERVWEVCTDSWGGTSFHYQELVISCVYVMLLILLTFIFSVVTWDCEENHRESR